MKIVEVKELPRKKKKNKSEEHDIVGILAEFMSRNIKIGKVECHVNEYANASAVQSTFHLPVMRNDFPIKVKAVNGDIYLIRTDM